MAVITFEEVNPTPIPNATVVKGLVDGVHRNYRISPNDGYVLHDGAGDWVDDNGTKCKAYYRGGCSCGANYDFMANPREFCVVPENEVPTEHIF